MLTNEQFEAAGREMFGTLWRPGTTEYNLGRIFWKRACLACAAECERIYGPYEATLDPKENTRRITQACAAACKALAE